jgi:hypothetical protein
VSDDHLSQIQATFAEIQGKAEAAVLRDSGGVQILIGTATCGRAAGAYHPKAPLPSYLLRICNTRDCLKAFLSYLGLKWQKCERSRDACVGSCPSEAIYTAKRGIKAIDQENVLNMAVWIRLL